MVFWNKICGLFLFLLSFPLLGSAQNGTAIKFNYHPFTVMDPINRGVHPDRNDSFTAAFQNIKPPVSESFSTSCYGFFCREELKIEKAVKLPVHFRLGSLEQCNYYEGKRQ